MGRKSDWSLQQQLEDGKIISDSTCWLWRQKDKRGYGKLTLNYKTIDVHRASASIYLGLDLNSNIKVLHKCKNKHCFNPDHLYLGSQCQNILDSVKDRTHVNARKTHCNFGHPLIEPNIYTYNNWRCCKICSNVRSKERYARITGKI